MGEAKLPTSIAFRGTACTHPGLSLLTEPRTRALRSSPVEGKSAPLAVKTQSPTSDFAEFDGSDPTPSWEGWRFDIFTI